MNVDCLTHNEITDSVGRPLEIPNHILFGIKKRLDVCLSAEPCEIESPDCLVEVVREGVSVTLRYCDMRIDGNPVNVY